MTRDSSVTIPHPGARLLRVTLLVVLLGCAAQGPPLRPTDFPFHATELPGSLHWRLDSTDGAVTAVGFVEVTLVDRISEVMVELQGLDKDGRVLSRGFDRAVPRAFSGDVSWPFTVRLRPTGREDRFTLRIAEFTWKVMRGGR